MPSKKYMCKDCNSGMPCELIIGETGTIKPRTCAFGKYDAHWYEVTKVGGMNIISCDKETGLTMKFNALDSM